MFPDYSNTYFPPPQGAASASSTSQSEYTIAYYPPPLEPAIQHTASRSNYVSNTSYQPAQPSPRLPPSTAPPQQHAAQTAAYLQPHPPRSYTYPSTTQAPQYIPHTSSQGLPPPPPPLPPPPQPSPSYQHQPTASPQPSPRLPQTSYPQSSPRLNQSHPSITATSSSAAPAFRTQFASLSLHASDRIQLLRFPTQLIPLLRATILSAWSRGIQEESSTKGTHDFKLKGNPWGIFWGEMKILKGALGDLEEEAIYSRRLICSLLAALHGEGWVLMMSTDVSKVTWDTDTLIFRHQSPAPAACEWFSIAFSSSNRLRFIDAPASVYLPIVQRLGKNKVGIKCKEHRVEGCYEVKLAGLGWGSVNWDSAKLRLVLLDILEVMEEEGWTVYASIDQKVGGEREGDTDTWHCCRPKGWEKGAPVYHN